MQEPETRRSSSPLSGGAGSTRSRSHSDSAHPVKDTSDPPLLPRESLVSRLGNAWKRLFRRRKYTSAPSHYSNSSFVGQAHTTTTSLVGASATAAAAGRGDRGTASQHNASGFRLSMVSAWNDMNGKSAEQLLAEKVLKAQVAHYSTMRVHMKRVQLCLEQEKRNKFYKELLVYLVFLVVILCALLSLPIHFPYEQNAALKDLFFDEEFPNVSIKKTFDDVMVESELWQWVDGPLLAGFYDPPIRNSRRLGSVMLRTGKVRAELCRDRNGPNDFVLFDGEVCFPEFTAHKEDTAPFGGSSNIPDQLQYTWTPNLGRLLRSQTFNPSLLSHEMDYGHGGFAVYLPRDNVTAAEALVAQLKTDFLSDGTRYFAANFAYYNPRSTIFTHVQALFEMSDTDYMETTSRVKSFRILASHRDAYAFLRDNAFVLVLCLATLGLLFRELSDLREYGLRKYVHSLWNLLDVFQLVLLIVFMTHWVTYLVRSENLREDLHRVVLMDCSGSASDQKAAADCYVDIEPLAWSFSAITNIAAALALVSIAIIFKYLRLNSRLNLLWRTLRFAAKDLLAFVAIFFVMFVGFAIMGFLTFGSATRQYHSISVSLTSCFQMLLGAFDYNQIYNANPAMAGVFFFSFMICIYLICVNMFIAIMSEYYSHAQNEKKDREANKRSLLSSTGGTDTGGASGSDTPPKSSGASSSSSLPGDNDESLMDVEYDLAKQVKNYVRGQRVFVKLPPKKDAASAFVTEQLLLCGYQRVLLIDYKYLMAERRRLRGKFRSWVHTVMWCLWIKRKADPDATMEVEHKLVVDKRRRALSTDSYTDLVEFPVTYLPIASTAADTVAILKRTRRGMHIEMDDGSLTKDQITLEVLGGQNEYIPPHYTRQAPPITMTPGRQQSDNGDDHDTLEVRISEISTGGGDSSGDKSFFGFRHVHAGIGGPEHIRCCRVLYNGDTLLNGMEECLLPRRTWVQYFVGHVFWSHVRHLVSFKKKKKKASRLVTDADVDKLIKESFAAPGRGISCRFDELVRNFRMFIAKKVHKRNIRVTNIDDRIYQEVITFLERFPSALTPLDKRELEGYKYTPQPVDTRSVRLPNSINLLSELLSQNAHEVWAVGRIQQGWRWGPQRDNDELLHPDLVPYEDLTEQDKQYDRDTSMSTLKVITALGYILEPPSTAEEIGIEFGEPALEEGGTYEPKPIPTGDVKVPGYLRSVIELLAENTHEVWAKMRMEQGWKYGPRRNDDKKEHNGLVPYMYLTHDEKQMDRNTAMQTVKVILRCGFVFNHRDQLSSSRRPRKKQSGQIKAFGRNENPEAKNVGDAVSLARGTARAKRAFLKKNNSTRAFTNRTSSSIGGGGGSSFRSSASFESTHGGAPERNLLSYASSSSFMDAEPLAPAIESSQASSHSSQGDDIGEATTVTSRTSLTTTHEESKAE